MNTFTTVTSSELCDVAGGGLGLAPDSGRTWEDDLWDFILDHELKSQGYEPPLYEVA